MGWDIYGYDLTTRQMSIIVTGPETQYQAEIDEGLLVYTQSPVGSFDSELLVHHLSTGDTYRLYRELPLQNQYLGTIDIDHQMVAYEDVNLNTFFADILLARQLSERLYLPLLAQPS